MRLVFKSALKLVVSCAFAQRVKKIDCATMPFLNKKINILFLFLFPFFRRTDRDRSKVYNVCVSNNPLSIWVLTFLVRWGGRAR